MALTAGLKGKNVMGRVSRGLSVAIVVASLAAFGWVASEAVTATDTLASVSWVPFAAAVVLQLVALVFLMLLWERLLGVLSGRGAQGIVGYNKSNLYASYSRTWLARYIPGRVWALGGRMLLASRAGVPAELVARSMAFEVLFSYSIVTVIGGALIVIARINLPTGLLVMVAGLLLVGMSVPVAQRLFPSRVVDSRHPSLWVRLLEYAQRFVVGAAPFTLKDTLWAVIVYTVYSSLQLAFLALIAASFVDLSLNQALIIAGAWGVSLTLGWLTFLVPVGLGVRDGLAFVLFSLVLDPPTASLVVTASRIVMIAADLVFVGCVELLVLGMNIKQTQPQASA